MRQTVITIEYEYDALGRVAKETRTETEWPAPPAVQPIPGGTGGWKPPYPQNPPTWPTYCEGAAPGTAYQAPVVFSYVTDNLAGRVADELDWSARRQ